MGGTGLTVPDCRGELQGGGGGETLDSGKCVFDVKQLQKKFRHFAISKRCPLAAVKTVHQ